MVKTLRFHCRGRGWLRSLVAELRSHMLRGAAKKEKNNKNKIKTLKKKIKTLRRTLKTHDSQVSIGGCAVRKRKPENHLLSGSATVLWD